MYYSAGNYESFARPRKPEGVEEKHAYIIGSGIAALTAACYLVRDGQMPGHQIHILEKDPRAGGSCDGWQYPTRGFVMRGGREMDNHFECMWDIMRSIPSIETEGISVLDEYYWLNKDDPNYSLMRATVERGKDANLQGKFGLSDAAAKEVAKLFLTGDEELYDKAIDEIFSSEVLESPFWMYWRTMFAFENWHSALEVKLYLHRYVHHVGGLPDFSALRFTKYNQYESLILPMVRYLEKAGVDFRFGTSVENVEFEFGPQVTIDPAEDPLPNNGTGATGPSRGELRQVSQKRAKVIVTRKYETDDEGNAHATDEMGRIELGDNDLVFITHGGCTEGSRMGGQNEVAPFEPTISSGDGWNLWKKIAAQAPGGEFGSPEVFCSDPEKTNWMSATVTTLDDKIAPYIQQICQRDPYSGRVVTGGIVTVKDSSWLLSWTLNRQPQFHAQPEDQLVVWVYGLFSDKPGDYIKKPMRDCTGVEICMEWLYHMGVPESEIRGLAQESAHTVPVMMPYITAFFMPRKLGDRPLVVPDGAVNFAFLGQFAETERDTIFTTEYSVRTGMEAVYRLLNIERGVPEVWGSVYDVRCLLDATVKLSDGKKLMETKLPWYARFALKRVLKKIKGSEIEKLLKRYGLI